MTKQNLKFSPENKAKFDSMKLNQCGIPAKSGLISMDSLICRWGPQGSHVMFPLWFQLSVGVGGIQNGTPVDAKAHLKFYTRIRNKFSRTRFLWNANLARVSNLSDKKFFASF